MSSKNTPPVYAVSGSHAYLRDREIRRLIAEHNSQGWKIEYLSGDDISSLVSALSPSAFFEEEQSLVVVSKPDKADLRVLRAHLESEDYNIVALLCYEGDPKDGSDFGKFLKKLGKSHKTYAAPKEWESEAQAVDFCIAEAKKLGKQLSPDLARAIIVLTGTDLGFLSFEILKIATLADVDGVDTILADQVRGTLAPIAEMAIVPIVDAVAQRNPIRIAQAMERLRKSSKNDPTMAVSSFLANSAANWLGVIDLREKNIPADDAAKMMQVNAWFYKNKVMPQAAKWTKTDTIKLIQALAEAKRAVLSGQINPWIVLSSRLMELCR